MSKVKDKDNPYNLTEKQQLFCMYFIKNFNGTMSYVKAFKAKYNTSMTESSKLLRNPNIIKEIKRLKKIITKNSAIEAKDVFNMWVKIAFSDVGDYVKWTSKEETVYNGFGQPVKDENNDIVKKIKNYVVAVDSNELDTSIVTEVSQGKDGFKIKLADKIKALEKLSVYFDLFPKENKIDEIKDTKRFIVEYVKAEDKKNESS